MARKTPMSLEVFEQYVRDALPGNYVGFKPRANSVERMYQDYLEGANPKHLASAYADGVTDCKSYEMRRENERRR